MDQKEALYIVSAMLENDKQNDEQVTQALTFAKQLLEGVKLEVNPLLVAKLLDMKQELERRAQQQREALYAMGALMAANNSPKDKMAQAIATALLSVKPSLV